jgi:DNA-binding XRE family transcriptional regulator
MATRTPMGLKNKSKSAIYYRLLFNSLDFRQLLRLRQEDLSEMSGVAIKTIHLIEKGSGNPSIATMEKIATVLGLELMLQVRKMG